MEFPGSFSVQNKWILIIISNPRFKKNKTSQVQLNVISQWNTFSLYLLHITKCADKSDIFVTFKVWNARTRKQEKIFVITIFQKMTIDYHPVFHIFPKLEMLILISVIFKIHSHINLNQKNKTKLSACNVTTVLLKLKKKDNWNCVLSVEWILCWHSRKRMPLLQWLRRIGGTKD